MGRWGHSEHSALKTQHRWSLKITQENIDVHSKLLPAQMLFYSNYMFCNSDNWIMWSSKEKCLVFYNSIIHKSNLCCDFIDVQTWFNESPVLFTEKMEF